MAQKEFALVFLKQARDFYASDLAAMGHEVLNFSPGENGRSAYDITYEVVVVNDRITKKLHGEDPGAWPFEGWVTAPDSFKTPDTTLAEFSRSIIALVEAVEALDEAALVAPIGSPDSHSNLLESVSMAAFHLVYHDGQLNYLQTLKGDTAVHWD